MEKKLLTKTILLENQRVTIINLTNEGKNFLKEIKKMQTSMYSAIEDSLGLTEEDINCLSEHQSNLDRGCTPIDQLIKNRDQ